MKDRVRREYYRRLHKVLGSELSSGNKIKAANSLAVPVIDYSISILEWTDLELKNIDRKTRKILTLHKILHPRADVSRLYVPRANGGRGLRQIEAAYKMGQAGFAHYIHNCRDYPLVALINTIASTSDTSSNPITYMAKHPQPHPFPNINDQPRTAYKSRVRKAVLDNLQTQWVQKPLHGQFARQLQRPAICVESTFRWLRSGHVKGETEALLVAAQDQALRTHYYEKNILHMPVDGKCRLCRTEWETIDHIVSGCSALAPNVYIQRHDRICTYIHYEMCKCLGLAVPHKWYLHTPKPVVQAGEITILYNEQIHTDRTVVANKPDITVRNNQLNTCQIVDVAVPMDINVEKKEVEKILKYADLSIEISRMWNVRVEIIPTVVGALGTTTRAHKSYLAKLGYHLNPSIIQTIALYGTAHVLRRTLMS